MKKKIIVAYMKGLSKYRKQCFSFQNTFFHFRDIYALASKVMTSKVVSLKQYNTQSRISLEILKRCSSNLA